MFAGEIVGSHADAYEKTPEWLRGSDAYSDEAPDNIESLEEWRFVATLTQESPRMTVWRSHSLPGHKWSTAVRWFVMNDNTAIGCAQIGALGTAYFKCGCKHDYKTTHKRMCYWEGVCPKCGHHHMIDSSD
jgi:hypothetical protein